MDKQIIQDIEQLLRDISNLVKRKEREILEQFPITPPQFQALLLLHQAGDLTIGELSQELCLACSTMTDLVDRMEKNKVVERLRDVRDRRVIRIHLLPYGKELIEKVMQTRGEYLSQVLYKVSEQEAEGIKKHLTLILENIKK